MLEISPVPQEEQQQEDIMLGKEERKQVKPGEKLDARVKTVRWLRATADKLEAEGYVLAPLGERAALQPYDDMSNLFANENYAEIVLHLGNGMQFSMNLFGADH